MDGGAWEGGLYAAYAHNRTNTTHAHSHSKKRHAQVYNITPYLRYHPGGPDTLLDAAGTDATALFQKHHAWVNVEMLFACCVGTLAKPVVTNGQGRRVKWDEQGIQAHDAQRGVMFGASVQLATLLALQAAPMTCALAPPPGQAP